MYGSATILHLDGRHDAREDALRLHRVLEGERVHDGGEHADVVGLGAVHAPCGGGEPAEDVPATDHDGDLHPIMRNVFDLTSEGIEDLRVDTVACVSHEGLAGELQQDALVPVCRHGSSLIVTTRSSGQSSPKR